MFFACHGYADGIWKSAQMKMNGDGVEIIEPHGFEIDTPCNPIAYVCRNGHGHYPHAGTWTRIWGFANDVCSPRNGRTVEWHPQPILLHLPEHRDFWIAQCQGQEDDDEDSNIPVFHDLNCEDVKVSHVSAVPPECRIDDWASAELNFESSGVDAPALQYWARVAECEHPKSKMKRIFRFS